MKKAGFLIGLALFLAAVGADVRAADCGDGFATRIADADTPAQIGGHFQPDCDAKKAFHIPAAVPLFLSAIAGLGVVALGGRP